MTDDSRFRSPRAHVQPQAQPAAAASGRVRRTEDPLAELARLIGQEDPFADFVAQRPADSRSAGNLGIQRRTRPPEGRGYEGRPAERIERRRPLARSPEQPLDDLDSEHQGQEPPRTNGRGSYAYGGARPARTEEATPAAPRSFRQDTAPTTRTPPPLQTERDVHRDRDRPPALETRHARRAPEPESEDGAYEYSGGDYDPDYVEDGYLPAHGDEFYDEAPRRRLKPWLLAGTAVLAVAILGASGLFAYRAVFGVTTGGTNQPVTIRSETGPTKVVPGSSTKAADTGSNKQIYDRVGGEPPASSERIVSREERPIETANTNPATPSRLPGGGTVTPVPQAVSPVPVTQQPPASTEPKRVRTVTVRSDGSVVTDPNRAVPTATQQRSGNSPLALSNPAGTNPVPTAPPSRPATTTAPQPGDNPWATVTNPTPTAFPPQSGPVASNPPPSIAVQPAPPAGSYVVQVAAQKSEAEAASTWSQLQQKYPTVLGSQQASIRRVDLGERGVFFRAQVGPFASRAQASEVCQSLKAAGGECVIQRN
jgi:hypothetical protein